MNVENILKVADAIEGHTIPTLGFNMLEYTSSSEAGIEDMSGHNCGTVACIGGWAATLASDGKVARWTASRWRAAVEYLGLEMSEANDLFVPHDLRLSAIEPSQAVAVLRHLAKTGEVDWSIPLSPAQPMEA